MTFRTGLRRAAWVALALLLLVVAWAGRVLWHEREHAQLRQEDAIRLPVSPMPTPAPVVPRQPACIVGMVVDQSQPVAGMQISVSAWPPTVSPDCPCVSRNSCMCQSGLAAVSANPQLATIEAVQSVVSDQNGRFSLCGLEGTSPRLIWGEHADGRWALPPQAVEVVRVGDAVVLEVRRQITVLGEVRGAVDPLPGARVVVWSSPPVHAQTVTTDARGRFQLRFPAGQLSAVASAPGFAPLLESREVSEGTPLLFELSAASQLHVHALSSGRGLAGAQVKVDDLTLVADREGWVHFQGVLGGVQKRVLARADSLIAEASVRVEAGKSNTVELELEPAMQISGVVHDEHGKPVEGLISTYDTKRLKTEPDGTFRTAWLIPEEVMISVDTERCGGASMKFEPGVTPQPIELKVSCDPAVTGVVLTADRHPVENAMVWLEGELGNHRSETGPDGTFRLSGGTGAYRLSVGHDGFRPWEKMLQTPVAALEVVLDAGGSISGRVVDEHGEPAPNMTVTATSASFKDYLDSLLGREASSLTDTEGRFVLRPVPAGRVLLMARGDRRGLTLGETLVLQPGEQREGVIITLDARVDLRGQVLDGERRPVATAVIRWSVADEKALIPSFVASAARGDIGELFRLEGGSSGTDLDGHFELRGISVPQVKLAVSAPGFRTWEQEVARDQRVDVSLQRIGGKVVGRVIDDAGHPLRRFTIDGTLYTPDDGHFELVIDSEKASVRFEAPGYGPLRQSVALTTDRLDVGDVVLSRGAGLELELVSEDGTPVPGIRAVAVQEEASSSCTSRPDGHCRLGGLARIQTTVRVDHEGWVSVDRVFTPEELTGTQRVVLKPARGRVRGQVFEGPGQPHVFGSVTLNGKSFRNGRTGADGRFEFDRAPEGPACLTTDTRGPAAWVTFVEVTQTDQSAVVGPGATGAAVEVHSVLPGRLVLRRGTLGVVKLGDVASRDAFSWCDGDHVSAITVLTPGDFRLEGIPPGRWTVNFVSLDALGQDESTDVPSWALDLAPGQVQRVPP